MISKTSTQTINALLELSYLTAGKTMGVSTIAKRIKVPENYLGKVLQRLAKVGIVHSQKGLHGGFCLAKQPKEITLYDIVSFLEDTQRWEGCFLGRSSCSNVSPCTAHQRWESARREYMNFLINTTLLDLKKS